MSDTHADMSSKENLVKMAVSLPKSDWHDYGVETLWAEPIGEHRYRVRSVPFFANGLAFDDVVTARLIGGRLIVQSVAEASGHSTYRLFLAEGVSVTGERFLKLWEPLQELGATFEGATNRLLTVDIPATSDVHRAYHLLQAGEESGAWDFQEGHCGHQL